MCTNTSHPGSPIQVPRPWPSAVCEESGSGTCPADSPLPLKYQEGWPTAAGQLLQGPLLRPQSPRSSWEWPYCQEQSRLPQSTARTSSKMLSLSFPTQCTEPNHAWGLLWTVKSPTKSTKMWNMWHQIEKRTLMYSMRAETSRGSSSSSLGTRTLSGLNFSPSCAICRRAQQQRKHWFEGYI